MVERRGTPMLSVVRYGGTGALAEIGCDYVRAAWWFTWSDGKPIAPVQDAAGVVRLLVRVLD
jgi:hypothetical protein